MSADRTHEALQSVCFVYEKPGRKPDLGSALATYILCIAVMSLCAIALCMRSSDLNRQDHTKDTAKVSQ